MAGVGLAFFRVPPIHDRDWGIKSPTPMEYPPHSLCPYLLGPPAVPVYAGAVAAVSNDVGGVETESLVYL